MAFCQRFSHVWEAVRALPATFWIAQFVFLGTGLSNNMLASQISYMGAGDMKNGLEITSLYVGQLLSCFCFPNEWRTVQWGWLRKLWWIMILDIVCAILYYLALFNIGSGMATVLYSAIVVFSGLFQRLIYNKRMSWARWVAVVLIPIFVSVSAIEQVKDNSDTMEKQILGCCLIIASAFGYALLFVLYNKILDTTDDTNDSVSGAAKGTRLRKPTSTHMTIMLSLNAIPCLLFVLCYAIPQWSDLMFNDDEHKDRWAYGSTKWTILFYLLFIVSNGGHQQAFFFCVSDGPVAAVSSGVNKALQAALTFLASDILFCGTEHDQCLTTLKTVGMVGISVFVLWYSTIDLALGYDASCPAPTSSATPPPPKRNLLEAPLLGGTVGDDEEEI